MSDVFVSYARDDRDRVEPLVRLLEARGWQVWWDREILPGSRFEQIIDEAIVNARCVIVVWTANSVKSDWVNAEAGDGLERGILVPVMFESVRLPLAFRRWQAARLIGWPQRRSTEEEQRLLDAVDNVLHGRRPPILTPGQIRPATPAARARKTAIALAGIVASALLAWWVIASLPLRNDTRSNIRQLTLMEPMGSDRSYLAGGLIREVVSGLKRYPELMILTNSDGANTSGGYVLRQNVADDEIYLKLENPNGETLLQAQYRLDGEHLFATARDVSKAILQALDMRFIAPVGEPLSGDDLRLYLQATNALRASESTILLDEAEKNLQGLQQRHPRHVPILVALCRVNLRMFTERLTPGYFEAAERHCHRAVTLDNQNVEAALALGQLYSNSGMHNEAIDALVNLTDRTPYNVEAIRTLGEAYLEAGAHNLAQAEFRRAVELEPGYWRNHKALGDVLLREGRYADAVDPYWQAVALARNKSGPLGDVAAALYLSGEFEDAVDVWLQALELEPLPPTYSNLGSAYFFLAQFEQAAAMFDKAIELTPDDYRYWGHAGEARLQLADGEPRRYFLRAIALASQARTINPNDPHVLAILAAYHAALGEAEPATSLIAKARSISPDDIDVLYAEALVYSRLGMTKELKVTIVELIDRGYSSELIERDANFRGVKMK